MNKNKMFFHVGLWIFLFTLTGSIIFSSFQWNHPKNLNTNIAYATLLGFVASLFLVIIFSYITQAKEKPTPILDTTINPETITYSETSHYSGELSEEDGLPMGYVIIYENASQRPVLSTVDSKDLRYMRHSGMFFTVVKFGNGKVMIESRDGTVDLRDPNDNFKIIVKYRDETKVTFGY